MNNANNTPEARQNAPVYSTLSTPPERKARRSKGSSLGRQLKTLIILGATIVVLAIGVGVAALIIAANADGIIDTFTESRTDAESGKVTYVYHSRVGNGGYIITNENGEELQSYYVDADGNRVASAGSDSTLVFETAIGSLLRLTGDGQISYYALVDYNGEYVGGDTECRVLVFPNVDKSKIGSIKIFNRSGENGAAVEFDVVGLDTDGDGKNDHFQIKGYERSTINQLVMSALASYSGYTITLKKLSIDFMEAYDLEHADEEGYVPLLDENKNIRFSEYGLDEESASYYEITTLDGEKHRLYIGSESSNGGSYYVRYYSESEGHRNAVYRIADDPGVSTALGVDLSRDALFLSRPETLVYPQINYPTNETTFLMAESFKTYFLDKSSESGYRKVIDFSYIDLEGRNYTIDQVRPYALNDKSVLAGYILDADKVSTALDQLYDISSLLSADYTPSAVHNYVSVVKLLENVLSGAQARPSPASFSSEERYLEAFDKYAASVEATISEELAKNGALYQLLDSYGLAEPKYKFSYYTTAYAYSNVRLPIEFNCVWVSELTENNTYFVWSPMYQQILEIGYQYLTFINWDSFDWVTDDVTDISINFIDSIRVTGKDQLGKLQDILFELDNSYDISWSSGFIPSYTRPFSDLIKSSKFNVVGGLGYDGKKTLTLQAVVEYTVELRNPQTGESSKQTNSLKATLLSNIDLEVVKTYCRWVCAASPSEFYASLSSEMQQSLEAYASSNPSVKKGADRVEVTHTVSDAYAIAAGNHYLEAKNYTVTISYDRDTENLSVTAGQQGQPAPLIYDERVFDNYILLNIKNDPEKDAEIFAGLTDEDLDRVADFYYSISGITSIQSRLRVTVFDEGGRTVSSNVYLLDKNNSSAEGSVYISAFRKFYQTILFSNYAGFADEAETIGGSKLTVEQMEAYQAAGDNCDLKIDVRLTTNDTKYVYRMYNYSAVKTYITVEANETNGGEGLFYINRTRCEKFLSDAVRASLGDDSIEGDQIY